MPLLRSFCGVGVFFIFLSFFLVPRSRDVLLSFEPCWWYFVMKLSSLQGDYNGEEIAKVMELVELEEAEKKRQAG